MSVNPGFGGQSFIESALRKIEQARRLIDASGRDIRLEVDGGIKVDNIGRVAAAGADTFVAGSAIFGQPDYGAVIGAMRAALVRKRSSRLLRSERRPVAPKGECRGSRPACAGLDGTNARRVSRRALAPPRREGPNGQGGSMTLPLYSIPGAALRPAAAEPAPLRQRPRTVDDVLAQSQVEAVLDELDRDLVGLVPVKQRIRDIAALLVIDKLRASLGLRRRRRRCT